MACPDSAITQAILDGHSLSLSAISKSGTAVQELLKNAAKGFGLVAYVKSVLFQSSYMANWLPPGSAFGWRALFVNALIIVSLLSIVGIITQFLYSALLGRQEGVRDQAIVVNAALVSLGALAVVQIIKNAYEATLVVPLLIVIAGP
jgi:hypothetical protein